MLTQIFGWTEAEAEPGDHVRFIAAFTAPAGAFRVTVRGPDGKHINIDMPLSAAKQLAADILRVNS